MGVVIPLILAPNATASKKRARKVESCVTESATGMSKSATVELESVVPSATLAVPSAVMIPRGVLGKNASNFLAMILCSPIFSVATASMKPPRKRKIIGLP